MRNKLLLLGVFLAVCIAGGIYYLFQGTSNAVVKPVIHNSESYPYFEIEELTDKAATVIHGVVRRKGKPHITKIPLSTEIDVTDQNKGKYLEIVETPVYITVKDSMKQKHSLQKEIVYKEQGGEWKNQIYEPQGGFLNVGDEVVIFHNDSGRSWGSLGVLRISDVKLWLM